MNFWLYRLCRKFVAVYRKVATSYLAIFSTHDDATPLAVVVEYTTVVRCSYCTDTQTGHRTSHGNMSSYDEDIEVRGLLLYGVPHLQHRRRQPPASTERSLAEDVISRQRQAATIISSRYVEAQMRNRAELARLNERCQTLDKQRRSATSLIERSKRKFAAEMADVARTTSNLTQPPPYTDLLDLVSPLTSPPRRARAATASRASAASRHHASLYDRRYLHGKDDGIAPALVALQVYERQVDRSRQCELANRTGMVRGVTSESTVASSNTAATVSRGSNNTVSATKTCQSATAGPRSALARPQDFRFRRLPTFSHSSRPDSFLPDTIAERGVSISQIRLSSDFAANAEELGLQEAPKTGAVHDGTDADEEREFVSRWRRDLKREAPPALHGYRPTLNFHAVMSQAERRRRLTALQTRQRPLLRSTSTHGINYARNESEVN